MGKCCGAVGFSPLMFDARRAFGLVVVDYRQVEPSRILREESFLSLTTTQGLVLWAGLKVQL